MGLVKALLDAVSTPRRRAITYGSFTDAERVHP
jgi:hypothetical protein